MERIVRDVNKTRSLTGSTTDNFHAELEAYNVRFVKVSNEFGCNWHNWSDICHISYLRPRLLSFLLVSDCCWLRGKVVLCVTKVPVVCI